MSFNYLHQDIADTMSGPADSAEKLQGWAHTMNTSDGKQFHGLHIESSSGASHVKC